MKKTAVAAVVPLLAAAAVFAQFPRLRRHTVNAVGRALSLYPAGETPASENEVAVRVEGAWRIIESNGIPGHKVGRFPNRGNPHRIEAQRHSFRVPAEPRFARGATPVSLGKFGVAVNGVPFDPGAAEWYEGDRGGGWQYEALSGAIPLGIDAAMAHVQPAGAYHYHGVPRLLIETLDAPLVGWAADGFPIYYDGKARSSYRLKKGARPEGDGAPGGTYDGTFVRDYAYVKGLGDLDDCSGKQDARGNYGYYLTDAFPVIPRCFKGTPSRDFQIGRPGGHGHRGPPRRRHPRH